MSDALAASLFFYIFFGVLYLIIFGILYATNDGEYIAPNKTLALFIMAAPAWPLITAYWLSRGFRRVLRDAFGLERK